MINYTIQNLYKLAAKASLLFMSLLIMAADNQCSSKGNPGNVIFKVKTLSLTVDEKKDQAPIVVTLTVQQGTLDPTQWTITTNNLKALYGATLKNVKLTCSEENKKLSEVGIKGPITAGQRKEFTINLQKDPKQAFNAGGTAFNLLVGDLIVKCAQGNAQVAEEISVKLV